MCSPLSIARSTLLEGVARSTQYEALLPSQVPKTFTVIWWQVKNISQHANIYSTIHSAVSYSNLESSLEIDRKRNGEGRRLERGGSRRTYLFALIHASSMSTFAKAVLMTPAGSSYFLRDGAANTAKRMPVHISTSSCLGTHVIYMPARVPHLPARFNVLASRIARTSSAQIMAVIE